MTLKFNTFSERFYTWATAELRREVHLGYPILGNVQDIAFEQFQDFVAGLSSSDLALVPTAFCKRFHTQFDPSGVPPPTADEASLIERYLKAELRIDHAPRSLSKTKIKAYFRRDLEPHLPAHKLLWDDDELVLQARVGDVSCRATLDFESEVNHLSYSCEVSTADWTYPQISALSCFGISFATNWAFGRSERSVYEGFLAVYVHFIEALRGLTE